MVKEVVAENDFIADVVMVKDINKILDYPILTTPGLVIDEKLICSGRIPGKEEILSYIKSDFIEQNTSQYATDGKQNKEQLRRTIHSALAKPEITIVEGGGCACQAGMTRAVVVLSDDLTTAMQGISELIKGCAYNPKINRMGFCRDGMGIIIEPKKMTIHKATDEAAAGSVIEWLKDIVK
jgi:hypothetical protein